MSRLGPSGRRRSATVALVAVPAAALLIVGCDGKRNAQPPMRASDPGPTPSRASSIAVPVELDTDTVRLAVEGALPRTLWTINQHSSRCVKPQRVKLFGARINVTPPISCTIVGRVSRGVIRLRGEGSDIIADVPINARIGAHDIGGILKGETVTGSAMAHARIRLDLTPDWTPRGRVSLSYGWTKPPGIDFLGQRIIFADQADEKLAPLLRRLEHDLPRALARAGLRDQVARLWRQGFASIELNARAPPVWMRITPRGLSYGGYTLTGSRLRLNLGLEAMTETFVGPRPETPEPTRLPALNRSAPTSRLRFFVPVIADYAQLEPVILRALKKRERRPFVLPAIGAVMVRFDKVVAYGTEGGKIAVGVTLSARPGKMNMGPTSGVIWLVARPVNAAGSARVAFTELSVSGDTDGMGGDLLIRLGNSQGLSEEIARALTQNFSNDVAKLLDKVKRAIAEKQTGDFVIRAQIERVHSGEIAAHGRGFYLPVDVAGTAEIAYRPSR